MKLSKAHNLRALCNGIEIKKRGRGTKENTQEPGSVALLPKHLHSRYFRPWPFLFRAGGAFRFVWRQLAGRNISDALLCPCGTTLPPPLLLTPGGMDLPGSTRVRLPLPAGKCPDLKRKRFATDLTKYGLGHYSLNTPKPWKEKRVNALRTVDHPLSIRLATSRLVSDRALASDGSPVGAD